jgi:flagellin
MKNSVSFKEEINRIADTTTFNGTKLLNGDSTQITLQIGDTAATTNQLGVKISSIKTDATDMNIDGEKIDSYANAKTAVSNVKNAINYVSSIRGKLGAYQNRLEHTVNNLGATSENMTAAESRIRDVDMAKEMMSYTKNNILVQASQAMLAQANQLPQGVLQLLQ